MTNQPSQILFIGPATREDAGFLHSYDVVSDSFQWEEDFSEWYKLAGSMVCYLSFAAAPEALTLWRGLGPPYDVYGSKRLPLLLRVSLGAV
jgi:hypothetical protein